MTKMNLQLENKTCFLPKFCHINQEVLEILIEDHQVTKLRCGEWVWSGWCWSLSGKEECEGNLFTFITRMLFAQKQYKDQFLNALEENNVSFEQIAQQCIDDLKSGKEDLYSLTGDNGRWHFGDAQYDHMCYDDEKSWYVDESDTLNETEFKVVWENVWLEMPAISYEGFTEYQFGSDLVKMTCDALQNSQNFEEFYRDLLDIRCIADEDYSSYCDENYRIGMSDTIEKMRAGKYNEKNAGIC